MFDNVLYDTTFRYFLSQLHDCGAVIKVGRNYVRQPVFPLNAKKVRICEIMSGGFAVKIQQCVKNVRRFLVTFSLC